MKRYLFSMVLVFNIHSYSQQVTDVSGNIYETVIIGSQIWFKQNLMVTQFSDGTRIPLVVSNDQWSGSNMPAFCWSYNNVENKNPYGALYNNIAYTSGKLCPTGWRVPYKADFETLISYLGHGSTRVGGMLKEESTAHWFQTNNNVTNETGFSAVAGGYRHFNGQFLDMDFTAKFACADTHTIETSTPPFKYTTYPAYRLFFYDTNIIDTGDTIKNNYGYSVRCMKDLSALDIEPVSISDDLFYPNPAKNTIFLKQNRTSNTIIAIFDIQGKKCIHDIGCEQYIDISNLKSGIYILMFIDSNNIKTTKFLKQ